MSEVRLIDLPEFVLQRAIDKGIVVPWIIQRSPRDGLSEARCYGWRDSSSHGDDDRIWRYFSVE